MGKVAGEKNGARKREQAHLWVGYRGQSSWREEWGEEKRAGSLVGGVSWAK